jgi:MFS family permease
MAHASVVSDQPARLDRRFRIFWAGQAVSMFGDALPLFSLPLFVRYLTDGTLVVATSYSVETIAAVIAGFFGGVLIDRRRLRSTLITGDLVRAGAFSILAFVAASRPAPGSTWAVMSVMAVALVVGSVTALFTGAVFRLIPRLARGDALTKANSLMSGTDVAASVVAPSLAGLLIAYMGFWPIFAINAATFLVSAVSILALGRIDDEAPPTSDDEASLFAGLSHAWREGRIRCSTVVAILMNLVVGFLEATLVVAADEVGATTTTQKGFLYGMVALGAVFGAFLAPRVTRRLGLGRSALTGTMLFGAWAGVFAFTRYGVLNVVALVLAFAAAQVVGVSYTTIRQRYTPDHLLGRVATSTRAVAWSSLPVGALGGAAVADIAGYGGVLRAMPFIALAGGLAMVRTVLWTDTP